MQKCNISTLLSVLELKGEYGIKEGIHWGMKQCFINIVLFHFTSNRYFEQDESCNCDDKKCKQLLEWFLIFYSHNLSSKSIFNVLSIYYRNSFKYSLETFSNLIN